MKEEISEMDHAALAILRKTGLDVVEAAQLAHELLQASRGRGGRRKRARECIRLGEEALIARRKTVAFRRAVDEAMEARHDRRKRTKVLSGNGPEACTLHHAPGMPCLAGKIIWNPQAEA